MEISDLQDLIERTYGERDRARGLPGGVAWLAEEVGELARALRKGDHDDQIHEFGDVLAWTASLANQAGVSLEEAIDHYRSGCPSCGNIPCRCP